MSEVNVVVSRDSPRDTPPSMTDPGPEGAGTPAAGRIEMALVVVALLTAALAVVSYPTDGCGIMHPGRWWAASLLTDAVLVAMVMRRKRKGPARKALIAATAVSTCILLVGWLAIIVAGNQYRAYLSDLSDDSEVAIFYVEEYMLQFGLADDVAKCAAEKAYATSSSDTDSVTHGEIKTFIAECGGRVSELYYCSSPTT
jgi:hypothetical protein